MTDLDRLLATLDLYANGADAYCQVSAEAAKVIRHLVERALAAQELDPLKAENARLKKELYGVEGELSAMKESAAALDALEEWLRGAEFRFAVVSEVVGEGEMTVRLEHDVLHGEVRLIAYEKGDTLAQAIQAALSAAKAKEEK